MCTLCFLSQAAAHEVQVKAAAALANLSADRVGLEAMVAEQELVMSGLFAVARALNAAPGGGWAASVGGGDGRLRCFVSVALANAMSHPVLSRSVMTHPEAVKQICAFVLQIPAPRWVQVGVS